MSDKYCAHGFWLAKGCDECRDYERLVESQASDNAMIRDLTAKLQDAEAGIRLAEDWIDGLGRSLGLTRDDDGCWNMEGIEVTVDELRSRAEAAEAASAFLLRLTLEGGRIVSTASIKSVEIATAFNEGRMFVDRRHYGYVIVPEAAPQEIPESGGHIESADCWCGPTVEEHPGGTLIIHNQTH